MHSLFLYPLRSAHVLHIGLCGIEERERRLLVFLLNADYANALISK